MSGERFVTAMQRGMTVLSPAGSAAGRRTGAACCAALWGYREGAAERVAVIHAVVAEADVVLLAI
jgi:hypothetical protein